MEKIFDFEQVGKRMPYTVPDGFFDRMEENVVASLSEKGTVKSEEFASAPKENTKKARTVKIAVRSAIAVAAAIALFFVVRTTLPQSEPVLTSADDFASVELAFNNLSADDQDFLIQIYEEDDLFINP